MKPPPPIGQYSIRTNRPQVDPSDVPPRERYPLWMPDAPKRLKDAKSRKHPHRSWWEGLEDPEKARALFSQQPRRLKNDDTVSLADGRVWMSRDLFNRIRAGLGIDPLD